MIRSGIDGQRLIALFLLGSLAFSPPLLSIFSVDGMVSGIPVLYLYLFVVWAALIVLAALIIEVAWKGEPPPAGDEHPEDREGGA